MADFLNEVCPVPEKLEAHDQKYLRLLKKYPGILKPNFKEVNPKLGIKHVIDTKDKPPCQAETRPLLPGSEKEVKAKEAWQELVDLGILERVPPNTPSHGAAHSICSLSLQEASGPAETSATSTPRPSWTPFPSQTSVTSHIS